MHAKKDGIGSHAVVPHARWLAARRALLAEEKKFTRQRDRLSQRRRDLPWERVGNDYVFEAEGGKASLADLFEGRSQLVVYHFMFNPGGRRGARTARSGPTTSTASTRTSGSAT
jgi:predicted dithiol-disulfide oxidoreductase (DUF899 family)